jgi:CRP/FNR family cyclic AMP-dependent transcriptional regulator
MEARIAWPRLIYAPAVVGDGEAVEVLANIGMFRGLSNRELQRLAGVTKEIDFGPGVAITREGEAGGRFYVLLDGEADVRLGEEKINDLRPGDSFGELSLIDGRPRSATVVARTPVRTLSLASWNFRPLLREHPSIAEAMLLEMCERLREAQDSPLD